MDSRRARILGPRAPFAVAIVIQTYVITYARGACAAGPAPHAAPRGRRMRRPPTRIGTMLTPPDVLVLGGGGVLGEAWMMGVLAGVEDATGFDLCASEYFVGTSAGSIVAAHLIAGKAPRRPSSVGTELELAGPTAVGGLAAAAVGAARRAGAWATGGGLDIRAAGARDRRARRRGDARGAAAPTAATDRHPRRPPRAGRRIGRAVRRAAARRGGRPSVGPAGRVRESRRARRRRSARPSRPPAPCPGCSRRSRSADASTSTAASGARPTSTSRRRAGRPTCCA